MRSPIYDMLKCADWSDFIDVPAGAVTRAGLPLQFYSWYQLDWLLSINLSIKKIIPHIDNKV